MNLANALSAKISGRVLLHLICLVRRPDHASWHWQGIVRELSRNSLQAVRLGAVCISMTVAFAPMILAVLLVCRELQFLLV